MRTESEKLLYKAIVELSFVQENPDCGSLLCASSVGREIIEDGMKLLGVKNLSHEELPE